MTVVSDASPLIALTKIGALHVLPELFGTVLVAAEVFQEITVAGSGRPGADEIQRATWIEVKSCTDAVLFARWKTQFSLGAGETATILLAQELSATLAIVDERAARRFASNRNIDIIGSVGILEAAARKNFIPDLRGMYRRLLVSGSYIDRAILNRSLASFNLPAL